MVARGLSISRDGLTVDLLSPVHAAGAGMEGTGWADTVAQWITAAGDGATWRSSRLLPREMRVPVWLEGDEATIRATLDKLALILETKGLALLTMSLTDGGVTDNWDLQVIRTAGGNWQWGEDSGPGWLLTSFIVTAGDPYWTRRSVDTITISNLAAAQSVTVAGTGEAWPTWTATGPCTSFALTSGNRTVQYAAALAAGETVTVNARRSAVLKGTANAYDSLATVPRFWPLKPGTSTITATMAGAGTGSSLVAQYHARKAVMF